MGTTLPAATATRNDFDRLAEHYAFRLSDELAAFEESHLEVIGPLLDAVAVAPRFFGPPSALVLVPEYYPETPEDGQLFALIRTDLDVEASMTAFDRFCEEWWRDTLPRAAPRLIFGFEHG